jgi:hypothetical protein
MGAPEKMAFDHNEIEAILTEAATSLAPRLFTIYGTYSSGAPGGFVAWGMDFGDDRGALMYTPDERSIWSSSSAQQIHTSHRRIGDVKLLWLTGDAAIADR